MPFMLRMNKFFGVEGCEWKHLGGCIVDAYGHKGTTYQKLGDVSITKSNCIVYSLIQQIGK
jgi:hypothetical protein